MNFENPSDDDWNEFERQLANDDGTAAKAHLAAGNPIYYTEANTPRIRASKSIRTVVENL